MGPAEGNPPIAYLWGAFPLRTETFVHREVVELRRRGWSVVACGLHPGDSDLPADLERLRRETLVVYRSGLAVLGPALGELLRRPLRTTSVLARAAADALLPGEPMGPAARAKLILQAVAGSALAGQLRERGVVHIHCHFAHAPTSVGMYAARQLGASFSFAGHANDLYQRRSLLRRKLQRAAFVACISEHHRGMYADLAPDRTGRLRLIRCGVDADAWASGVGVPRRPSRPDGVDLLTVGRLVEKKGTDTLIDAVAQLRSRGMQVRLVVAGDGPLRPDLERRVAQLGLQPHTSFLGAVENDRVRELMRSADIFALPCRTDQKGDRDGIPVVLMEAMASGLPVVVGDQPAIRELVVPGSSGVLVPGGELEPLVAALAGLVTDGQERARIAAGGRARVLEEFSLERNMGCLEASLTEAVAHRSGEA